MSEEKSCPDCAETVKAAAKVCKHCGYRFDSVQEVEGEAAKPSDLDIFRCPHCNKPTPEKGEHCRHCHKSLTASPEDHPEEAGFFERVFDVAPDQRIGRNITIGLFLIVILICLVFLGSSESNLSKTSNSLASFDDLSGNIKTYDDFETEALTTCDLRIKSALVSESSFDPDGDYGYSTEGNISQVVRLYEATNGFNAKISSGYVCKVDRDTGDIVYLLVNGPFGVKILVDKVDGN